MIRQILTATLIVSAVATVSAQVKPTSTQPSSQEGKRQPGNQFNSRDYTQIQSSEVPSTMRTTLGGPNYKGWENGKIYRHNNGEGFYVTTGTGTNVKNYYFDNDGKAVRNSSNSMQRTTKEGTSISPASGELSGQDSISTGTPKKP
jgi:hypothetical protein